MNLSQLRYVHFLGIGGIGMSALARWFVHNGHQVSGYDRTETNLTKQLLAEGINIHFQDEIQLIPDTLKQNKEESLIIYTPAIPKNHLQFNWFLENGFTVKKRAEVLGMITKGMKSVAVAGTHGKTTTTSMLAHILKSQGVDCAAFMGGIATNYNTNLLVNQLPMEQAIAVVEADEYDRSFMHLHPNIVILTSTDADHLDIYGNHENMQDTFRDFVNKLDKDGQLFVSEKAISGLISNNFSAQFTTYGIEQGDFQAQNIKIDGSCFIFDAQIGDKCIKNIKLHTPGYHNVENVLAALCVALQLGLSENQIRDAIATYKGVKRRFEYHINQEDLVFIDDYAHHPGEIDSLLKSIKALYPSKKITAIFQPHLFSRTRDFADEFAHSLSIADEVIVMPIYPAREEPIAGVNAEMLLDKILSKSKYLVKEADMLDFLKDRKPEVLLTIGAGDIDRMVQPIAEYFKKKQNA